METAKEKSNYAWYHKSVVFERKGSFHPFHRQRRGGNSLERLTGGEKLVPSHRTGHLHRTFQHKVFEFWNFFKKCLTIFSVWYNKLRSRD